MKIDFDEKELIAMISDHLKSQGFNMRNRTVSVKVRTKFRGKGQGSLANLIAEITEKEPSPENASEDIPEPAIAEPIFSGQNEEEELL